MNANPFANAGHLIRYLIGVDDARTQTTRAETALLSRLAPGRSAIVELGVFEGASSLVLRKAMDTNAELYCVDPFPRGRLLFSPQMAISKREIRKSHKGRVSLLRQNSAQAAASWTKPIDLLFMDGDHGFEGACRDFKEWTRFIRQGGLIAIHTSRSSPTKPVPDGCGMVRLVKEVVANDPGFRIDSQVDSITVVVKL